MNKIILVEVHIDYSKPIDKQTIHNHKFIKIYDSKLEKFVDYNILYNIFSMSYALSMDNQLLLYSITDNKYYFLPSAPESYKGFFDFLLDINLHKSPSCNFFEYKEFITEKDAITWCLLNSNKRTEYMPF